jgi:hypothetical protein
LGEGQEPEAVHNIDAVITFLPDKTRWAASFMTLQEIEKIMSRWRISGEYLNGKYFTCQDLVIVSEPGVSSIMDSLDDILAVGMPSDVFSQIEQLEGLP